MGENSKIEWTDHTFNPWVGCTKVSPACDHCYAEAMMDHRLGRVQWGPHGERKRTSESNWKKPIQWNRKAEKENRRYRVFCASLADVFDNQVPFEWRRDLFRLINDTPDLDWLLLTKRPQNIAKMMPKWWGMNVWLGTTVENQAEADRRIPALLHVPAKVHFISCEPLLGPINLSGGGELPDGRPRGGYYWLTQRPCPVCVMADGLGHDRAVYRHPISCGWRKDRDVCRGGIDWVICGGESGKSARPMHPDWARSLRDQCVGAGVPFLFKQWGEWVPFIGGFGREHIFDDGQAMLWKGKRIAGRLLDGREWNEFPTRDIERPST